MQQDAHWLPFLREAASSEAKTPFELAESELRLGLAALAPGLRVELVSEPLPGRDAWVLVEEGDRCRLQGGQVGILYGVYSLLCALAAGEPLPVGLHEPAWPDRMLNGWDNMSGRIERGYSGQSLWFRDGRLAWNEDRLRQLGRLLASVGLNVLSVNNVNVKDAQSLIDEDLPGLARMAAVLRPFGVRLMVSIDFAQPLRDGLPTADPLDAKVQAWWTARADAVWQAVPDLYGFLVKADSENRPGPNAYHRTHAEGANMLARAIAPHGGMLVWRCFVYNCQQDWRDQKTDRPKAAYEVYQPLDGAFDDNVILQVKHGPFDFQVREPLSPLLLSLKHTRMVMELQLAQEYTGHQIDLYTMQPMWRELFEQLPPDRLVGLAAVHNLGDDACMTGHPFAAVNLYGYGLLCWNPLIDPAETVRRWARLTYALPDADEDSLTDLLMNSRHVYEQYTAPLGLCWMVMPGLHYGPNPSGYEYTAWGTYHRADRERVGIDRTPAGTDYVSQYPPHIRALYTSLDTCPDELLLFFHRLPYTYVMRDGRTLIQRIYDDHFAGFVAVEQMATRLAALPLPDPDRTLALTRMTRQLANARDWCDIINTFFHRLSGVPDEKGRIIYE